MALLFLLFASFMKPQELRENFSTWTPDLLTALIAEVEPFAAKSSSERVRNSITILKEILQQKEITHG